MRTMGTQKMGKKIKDVQYGEILKKKKKKSLNHQQTYQL